MGLLVYAMVVCALTATISALPECRGTSRAEFDYIVVGAGAGGGPLAARLAESGYSVLVVDAGHDVVNANTTIPLYVGRACEDPQLELNYSYNEYPAGFKVQRNGEWYPRARSIGGSTIHNAMVNIVAGTKHDFNNLSAKFEDKTWSHENMQEYFKRIEKNHYLSPQGNPDHGFNGWLETNISPNMSLLDPKFADKQIIDIATTLASSDVPISDLNNLAGVDATGAASSSFTMGKKFERSSTRDRLVDVHQASNGRLQFSLDTLATKILMCTSSTGVPAAFGIEIAPGAALAVASNFDGKSELKTKRITARHEVIISAGVFQSPQLLMVSGIGDKEQLSKFGIESVVHLPGVGTNLQDHDEIATMWRLKQNFTLLDGCKFLSDPSKDPCLAYWKKSGHLNVYSFGTILAALITRSEPDKSEPDIMTYYLPALFPGYIRGLAQEAAETHNVLTSVVLKAHAASRGTVRLTGSHPQDTLDIQKLHFQLAAGRQDIVHLCKGIKRARAVMAQPQIAAHVEEEIFPGPQAQTDEDIEQHVLEHVFGHHVCCTNAIGSDSDEDAVLNGDFRVRGVANLRVVDASSWSNVPGFFVTTPTYMMSEKAADVIISAAREVAQPDYNHAAQRWFTLLQP